MVAGLFSVQMDSIGELMDKLSIEMENILKLTDNTYLEVSFYLRLFRWYTTEKW